MADESVGTELDDCSLSGRGHSVDGNMESIRSIENRVTL